MPDSRIAVQTPLDIRVNYITFKMDVVNERAKAIASTVYEEEVGLSLRELRLMRIIATQPGLTISRLIEQAHIEKTLTSKALAKLTRDGLLLRTINQDDARQTNLYLTPEGAQRVQAADVLGQRMETNMLSVLSDDDIATFSRCLQVLFQINHDLDTAAAAYLQASHPSGKDPVNTSNNA